MNKLCYNNLYYNKLINSYFEYVAKCKNIWMFSLIINVSIKFSNQSKIIILLIDNIV